MTGEQPRGWQHLGMSMRVGPDDLDAFVAELTLLAQKHHAEIVIYARPYADAPRAPAAALPAAEVKP